MAKSIIEYAPQPVPRDEWIPEKPLPLLLLTAVNALHTKMMIALDAEAKEDYLRFYDSFHDSNAIEGSWKVDRCMAAIKMRDFANDHGDVIVGRAKLGDIMKASERVAKRANLGQAQRLKIAKAAALNGHSGE